MGTLERERLLWWGTPLAILLFLLGWGTFALLLNWGTPIVRLELLLVTVALWGTSAWLFRSVRSEHDRFFDTAPVSPTPDLAGAPSLIGAGGLGSALRASKPLVRMTVGRDHLVIRCRGSLLRRLPGAFPDIRIDRDETEAVYVSDSGRVSFESRSGRLDGVWFAGQPAAIRRALLDQAWPVR